MPETPTPMHVWRMTVYVGREGQARNYAPHVYHYRVEFETLNDSRGWLPAPWTTAIARPYLRAIKHWTEPGDEGHDWASPQLRFIKDFPDQPGVFEFRVEESYTG